MHYFHLHCHCLLAITGSKELVSLRKDVPSPVEGEGRGCEGVERRLRTLERVLKCLENVCMFIQIDLAWYETT